MYCKSMGGLSIRIALGASHYYPSWSTSVEEAHTKRCSLWTPSRAKLGLRGALAVVASDTAHVPVIASHRPNINCNIRSRNGRKNEPVNEDLERR